MRIPKTSRGLDRGMARACAFTALMCASAILTPTASASGIEVSSGGTAGYSTVIAVPPGIAGMVPSLALSYNGSTSNGPVGVGWALQGLSLITRCGASPETDGKGGGVLFAPGDRLCLDGQRLIETNASGTPVAASPAANGALQDAAGRAEDGSYTEYRTQKDTFARIRAYGMANGAVANGPRYFKVWTKSGQVLEFGAGPSADSNSNALVSASGQNVAVVWALARASDTMGNYIDYKYNQRDIAWGSGKVAGTPTTGREWNLVEIQYTGTPSQAPTNKVVFEYADRPDTPGAAQDRSEAYHHGSKTLSIQLLKAIRTYINWPGPALGVTASPGGVPIAQPSTAVKVKATKITYGKGPNTGRSRTGAIQECVGAAETTCLRPTSFGYNPGTSLSYTPSANFTAALGTTPLMTADGKMGVLTGDFNGDGRTDILRWSDNPAQNVIYMAGSQGAFTMTPTNVTAVGDNLNKSDGCYYAIAQDFDGDGKTDILRVMRATSPVTSASCGTVVNMLYLSQGNGQFTKVVVPSTIDLLEATSTLTTTTHCTAPMLRTVSPTVLRAPGAMPQGSCSNGYIPWYSYTRTAGKTFVIIDVNGDGRPDIITTRIAAYTNDDMLENADFGCSTCTHVYLGGANGAFNEYTSTNVAQHSLYGAPYGHTAGTLGSRPYVTDVNGDGLSDLQVDGGTWQSNGDGNFTRIADDPASCATPIDFNGDGRMDCLYPNATASAASLYVADGSSTPSRVANFNLVSAGQELAGATLGVATFDLDNDGRTDLIRWSDDPTKNVVYLSNGDGTFRVASSFNLNTTAYPLKKSNGTVDFVLGDFTGDGNVEILRLVSGPTSGSTTTMNQLFVKTSISQPEQLASVTTPSGLVHSLTWVTLPDSSSGAIGPRYASGASLGSPAVYPLVDLTPPMWVVATVESQTGVGSATVKTEYSYAGLRAGLDGRGLLGFMKMTEQHVAPDGGATRLETSFFQDRGFVGTAAVVRSYDAGIGAGGHLLSQTTSAYCDTTSTTTPPPIVTSGVAPAPCQSTALIQRPYLYQTLAEGWDIDAARTALPAVTTTNVYDAEGNPTSIVATTTGLVAGVQQTSTKSVTNSYGNEDITGDHWVLARLQSASVRNVVSNGLPQVTTSAGTSPHAADRQGPTPGPNIPAIMAVINSLLLSD